jgi:hypothetical protein
MSVLIKNMSMPKGCINCKLNNDSICVLIDGCGYDETNGRTRRPDCPLVEIPDMQTTVNQYGNNCVCIHNKGEINIDMD